MELTNATGMQVERAVAPDPRGRERVVVVIKGTFTLPRDGGEARLADEQLPIVAADTFTGEPGRSATVYESDLAPFKPRCDVVLHGSAYAPEGRPAKVVRVALGVGRMLKGFDVLGERVWTKPTLGFKLASDPVPFVQKPITYDRAYGGVDVHPREPGKVTHYEANPVGVGYYPFARARDLEGRLLPNTAELESKADSPKGEYRPMSFGPIGRSFQPRARLAGTYDEQWLEDGFPFLPVDFDPAYFQCAPPDQQIPYPSGGELVVLRNLTRSGRAELRLPRLEVPVAFFGRRSRRDRAEAVLDTIVIEPDEDRMALTWRASRFLQRSVHEVRHVVVGRVPEAWYVEHGLTEIARPPAPVVERVAAPEVEVGPPRAETAAPEPTAEPEIGAVRAPPTPVSEPAAPIAAPPAPTEPGREIRPPERVAQPTMEEDLTATMTWDRLDTTTMPAFPDLPELRDEEDDLTATLSFELAPWRSSLPIPDEELDEAAFEATVQMAREPSEAEPAPSRVRTESPEEFTATLFDMPADVRSLLAQVQEPGAPDTSHDEQTTIEVSPDEQTTIEVSEDGMSDTVAELPSAVQDLLDSLEPSEDEEE